MPIPATTPPVPHQTRAVRATRPAPGPQEQEPQDGGQAGADDRERRGMKRHLGTTVAASAGDYRRNPQGTITGMARSAGFRGVPSISRSRVGVPSNSRSRVVTGPADRSIVIGRCLDRDGRRWTGRRKQPGPSSRPGWPEPALEPLPASVRPRDVAEGYRVQAAVHEMLAGTAWGPVVGYKIGCTTPVMQQYLRIPHPCAGGLYSGRIHQGSASLDHASLFGRGSNARSRCGSDGPIGGRRALHGGPGRGGDRHLHAGDRAGRRALRGNRPRTEAPTLIADDFFAAGCVLGAPLPRDAVPDPARLAGQMRINGAEAARGVGADVMGHPHEPSPGSPTRSPNAARRCGAARSC